MVEQITLPGLDKQAYFRLAEAVDGLHRVAYEEQGASVAITPTGGELVQ